MVLRGCGQHARPLRGCFRGYFQLFLMLGLLLSPALTWGVGPSILSRPSWDTLFSNNGRHHACREQLVISFDLKHATCALTSTETLFTVRSSRLSVPLPSENPVPPTFSVLPDLPTSHPAVLGLAPRVFVEADIRLHTESVAPNLSTASSLDWQADLRHILRRPAAVPAQVRRPLPKLDEINDLLDRVLPHFDLDPAAIPRSLRRKLSQRIRTYVVRHRKTIQAKLLRADMYLPMIKHAFLERGLPTYYAYLPLVESAFRPDVQHPVSGARGLWQFIDSTAQMYGLKVSKQQDERLHPKRATQAAVRYIQALRKRFGADLPLHVLAAYNFGENNLSRRMKQAQTKDIWTLYRRRRIPSETREYLLRMIAMWVIVAQPGRFQLLLAEAADVPRPVLKYATEDETSLRVAQFVPQPGE